MIEPIVAAAILLVTVVLIVVQPRGVTEARAALVGAVAMLALRYVGLGDLWAVVRDVAGVLLFLLSMMVLTAAVERSGFFELLALWTARAARGSGYALFVGVFLLGAAITVLLSLDVTVLVLTPIVYAMVTRLRVNALPYMFVCAFVANTGSLLLPISNLTNLLVYGLLDIGFGPFARAMLVPQVVALAVNLAIFLVLFRGRLPRRFERAAVAAPWRAEDRGYLAGAAALLLAVLVALLASGLRGLPLYPPALVGGALVVALGLVRRRLTPRGLAREVSWSLFPFVIGMFTVIRGVENLWLPRLGDLAAVPARGLPALLAVAFGTALGANLLNNIPVVAALIGVLRHIAPPQQGRLALAVVLGGNLGPTVTPFGSLATLLWLTIVRRKGEELSTLDYMKVGVLVAPPVLLAATVALWAVGRGP